VARVGGLAVVADRLDRAAVHGLLAQRLLLGRFGLFEDEAVTAVVVALEIRGGGFTAKVAIDALVIDEEFAFDVIAVFVRCVCHKNGNESVGEIRRPSDGMQLFFEPENGATGREAMRETADPVLAEKLARCREVLRGSAPLLVAYSGGVDSACLLALAHGELEGEVLGVIADSSSLPRAALDEALRVAAKIGARVEVVRTAEFSDERYLENPPNRCYFCKAELFSKMESLARERGFRHIAYGENADDPADLRPGSRAAAEFRVLAPLKEAGLAKSDIRELSRRLGLPTHDAPAQPCLSSRIPHGTRVTAEALGMVERGEAALRAMGFRVLRVRYLEGPPPTARVQIDPNEMPSGEEWKLPVAAALEACGFSRVDIDPAGYRPPGAG